MTVMNNTHNGIFRLSAILYANNNYEISPKQIIRKIIEDIYFCNQNTELEISEIVEKIAENYLLSFSEKEIEDVIFDSKFQENFIVRKDNLKKYVSITKNRMITLVVKCQVDTLPDFINEFIEANGYLECQAEIIYRFLYGIFTSNVESFKKLLAENNIDILKKFLEDNDFISTNNDEEKNIINAFLNWDYEAKNKAIFDLASYALEYCMITNLGKATLDLKSLKHKTFYLDTNIIYRALGLNGCDRKKRTLRFLSKFKEVDEELAITQVTDSEFRESLNYNLSKIEKSLRISPNTKVLSDFIAQDEIYQSYLLWCRNRANVDVNSFKAHILSRYDELRKIYGINLDCNKPYKTEEEEDTIKQYIEHILSYSTSNKDYISARYDAENLLWLERKRNNSNSIFEAKVFFLSSDQALRSWDYNRNSNRIAIVMQPSQWLSIILRYINRSSDDYKSFVCFLNLKASEKIITDDKIPYIIAGIEEKTEDIQTQKELVRNFIETAIDDDFRSLDTAEIQNRSSKFAETELDKRIKNLEAISQIQSEELEKTKDKVNQQDSEISNLSQVISNKNKEISNSYDEKNKLQNENESLKESLYKELLTTWRIKLIATILGILICIVVLVFYFLFQDLEYNFIAIFRNYLRSINDSTLSPYVDSIVTIPFVGLCYLLKVSRRLFINKPTM